MQSEESSCSENSIFRDSLVHAIPIISFSWWCTVFDLLLVVLASGYKYNCINLADNFRFKRGEHLPHLRLHLKGNMTHLCLSNSSFMRLFILIRNTCQTLIAFCLSVRSISCVRMSVPFVTFNLLSTIDAVGSREGLLFFDVNADGPIIFENLKPGTSYSP